MIGKKRLGRLAKYAQLISVRAVLSILLGFLFFTVAYYVDYNHQARRPGTDFVQYTQFTAQNARIGEDINYTVCRTYDRAYHVDANLRIYVVPDPETPDAKAVEVYGRTQQDTLEGQCDNKVIQSQDYSHEAGRYELRLCSAFRVRYNHPKLVCITSNRYTVYDTPESIDSQLKRAKERIEQLERMRSESQNVPIAPTNSSPIITTPSTEEQRQVMPPPPSREVLQDQPRNKPPVNQSPPSNPPPSQRPPANNIIDGTRDLTCDVLSLICR